MLQVPYIRTNKEEAIKLLAKRNINAAPLFDEVLALDEKRRQTQAKLDQVLAESNTLSKDIGTLFKNGEVQKANLLKEKTSQLKEDSKALSEVLNQTSEALNSLLYKIPNIPHESVPNGNTDEDNLEVYKEGET